MEQKRIVLADDHPIVREGLREIIERDHRFRVDAEAGDGEQALRLARELLPHAVILDVEMPKMSGLDVAQHIQTQELPVAVLILTMFNHESVFNRAMDIGVLGYVLKDSIGPDIVRGLEAVLRGEYYISSSLIRHTVHRTRGGPTGRTSHGLDQLTPAEQKVFDLISQSKTSNQIAEELRVSHRTVEHHREHICQKLNLSGSYALLRYALERRALPGQPT